MAASEVAIPGLEKLHEVSTPEPVSWMPQTIGWYVVVGIALVVAGWWVYVRFRRFRANRYRRLALAEIAAIERELQRPERRAKALAQIPVLLKRTALSAFPRADVADLSGEKWLAFLDKTLEASKFRGGEGRLLSELAYVPSARISKLPDVTIDKVFQIVRLWIKNHKVILSCVVENEPKEGGRHGPQRQDREDRPGPA